VASTKVIFTDTVAANASPAGLAAKVTTTEGTLTEIAPGEMANSEAPTIVTSAPPLFIYCF